MPVHKAIAKAAYAPEREATVPIKTFQFLDDGAWAKVYLPLDNLSSISKADVEAKFQPRSFTVIVRNLQKWPLEFTVAETHGEVDPEQCVAKLLKSKILVKLRKVPKASKQGEDHAGDRDEDADSEPPALEAEPANDPVESIADMPVDTDMPAADVNAAGTATEAGIVAAGSGGHAEATAVHGDGACAAADPEAAVPPEAPAAESVDATQPSADDAAADSNKPAEQSAPERKVPKVQYAHWYHLKAGA